MQNNCDFVRRGELVFCTRCGREVETVTPPERVYATCRVECKHLGETLSQIKVSCDCPDRDHALVQVARCSVYDRCLPHWRPSGKDMDAWLERKPESDIYHLCHGCESFTASAASALPQDR